MMIKFLWIISLLSPVLAQASDLAIQLHFECQSDNCKEYISAEGIALSLETHPVLIIHDKDIVSASKMSAPGEPISLDIQLNKTATQQFADITSANIGRRLAIVIAGKLNSAPKIEGEISMGRFSIQFGNADVETLSSSVPWLEEKIEQQRKSSVEQERWSRLSLVAIGLLLGLGSLVYVFRGHKQTPSS